MRRVVLRRVLMLLASVSILVVALSGADAQAAGQLARRGGAVQRLGGHLAAQTRRPGCLCPDLWPGQRQVVPAQRQAIPPQIWLDSYSIKPGQSVGFGGRGFQPGERVDVRLGNLDDVPSKSASRLLVVAFANAGGNVTGEATIPFLPAGDYPFIVVGLESQEMLIRNLTVLGFAPWVVLDDYAPLPGAQLGFKGQGFAPGEPVLVYFDQQAGQQVTQLTADRDGQFAVYRGVESPAQPGDHALILVGVYSGSLVKVNFEILPPAAVPAPSPTPDRLDARTQMASRLMAGGSTGAVRAPGGSRTGSTGAVRAPASMERVFGARSFQNPVLLVLLVLLFWLLLSLLLVLVLLVAPLLQQWRFRRRSSQGTVLRPAEAPRSLPGARASAASAPVAGTLAAGAPAANAPVANAPVAPAGGDISPAPRTVEQGAQPAARFCPRCGVRAVSGASQCAICGGALPQMLTGAPEGKARALSQPVAASPPSLPWLPGALAGGTVGKAAALQPVCPGVPGRGRAEDRGGLRTPQAGLALRFSAKSDCGRRRAGRKNEDGFLAVTGARRSRDALQPFGLFVVADGMGGHDDGHKASGAAVEGLFHSLVPSLLQEDWPEHDLPLLLAQAIQGVNERLYLANQRDQTRMGCTVTAALVAGHQAYIGNVGDSRTYRLGALTPLQRVTVDHSLVESLVVAGIIQRADVYTHPKRNQIFRCLGHQPWVEVDTFLQPLASRERLLLCSDGLWEMVRDREMEAILRQAVDVEQASSLLVERANASGGLDNVTVIVVALTGETACLTQPGIISLSSTQAGLLVGSA